LKKEKKMYPASANNTSAVWLLGGFALGALTMYLMDPDRGNRRRALIRDKVYSAMVTTRKAFESQSRDLTNRVRGLRAEASSAVLH
jgi:hypothetical protein